MCRSKRVAPYPTQSQGEGLHLGVAESTSEGVCDSASHMRVCGSDTAHMRGCVREEMQQISSQTGRTPPGQDNQSLPEEPNCAEDHKKKGCTERSCVLDEELEQVSILNTGGQNRIAEYSLGIGSDILDLRQTEPPGVLSHTETGVSVTHGPVNLSFSDPSACRSMDSPLTGSLCDETISLRGAKCSHQVVSLFLTKNMCWKTVFVMITTIRE